MIIRLEAFLKTKDSNHCYQEHNYYKKEKVTKTIKMKLKRELKPKIETIFKMPIKNERCMNIQIRIYWLKKNVHDSRF